MANNNKVKFGLKNVYYAKITGYSDGLPTYATPVAWPGARSISLDPQGEQTPWYADNMIYYVANDNNGYQGDLEMAMMIDAFKKDILGYVVDANGLLIEPAETEAVHFALLFEFSGDANKTRHVLYNCTTTRPSVTGSTTEDSTEPETESSTITAMPIQLKADSATPNTFVKASCATGDTAYSTFFSTVKVPGTIS